MRGFDFSSWQAVLTTIAGITLITLLGVGIRLLAMTTIQQRRERENRQINERLRTLIAAYRTLGGSFTGDLAVDPSHLSDLRRALGQDGSRAAAVNGSDRRRRMRDAVEAALSDIFLLGTEEHVRLASAAAHDMAAGRPVHTGALVVSLRAFIRHALDLDAIPVDLAIPRQGPLRTAATGGRGKGEGGREEGRQGGGGGGGGGQGGGGGGGMAAAGMGGGIGVGLGAAEADDADRKP